MLGVKKEIKYLGVKMTKTSVSLYQENFLPLLDEIKTELNRIITGNISWGGERINIIKMVILPKIIHKMQMLPIPLPEAFFKTIQKLFTSFIWKRKKKQE